MSGKIRLITIILIIALIFNVFAVTLNVYANAATNTLTITFRNNYEIEQGKVQYSLDDGASWVDVTSNVNNLAINVTGDHLRIKLIANNGFRVDPTGIEFNGNSLNDNANGICGGMTNNANGYEVDNDVLNATLTNVEFREENGQPGPGPGQQGPVPIDGGTLVTGHFNYQNAGNNDPVDIWLNETEIGVGQPPEETCDYYYVEGSGKVYFDFAVRIDNKITGITINNTSYDNQLPNTRDELLAANQGQVYMIRIETDYAETYNIVSTTTRDYDWPIGNFLWSSDDADIGTDDYIGNGTLEFISAEYEGQVYTLDEMLALNLPFADWDEDNGSGGSVLPTGTILTVRLIPNSGYQLTSFTINGGEFEAGEDIGVYSFEVPPGNFHLGAHFTEVDDEVDASESEAVSEGTIRLTGEEETMEMGTARLDIKDIQLTPEQISNFERIAGDYDVKTFLDISLFNTVFKGTEDESWDTQVDELDHNAVITLKLADNVNGKNIVIVHEKHDGTYEIIETTYNAETNTISFRTNSFSNYAIGTKDAEERKESETESKTDISSNPKTGDNIMTTISVFVVATFGAIITKKIKANGGKTKH